MEKKARSVATPTSGQLLLEALARVRWQSLLTGAGRIGFIATTLAGLCALLVAWTLTSAQMEETRRIEAITAGVVQGATTDQARFEKIGAAVYEAVLRGHGPEIDRSQWIQPPSGPVGFFAARLPAASEFLRSFFEPHYNTFLKPSALQVFHGYSSDCAAASRLMIRMLASIGIEASKLGIHDEEGIGRHAVVEANIGGRLAIADANHAYIYRRPDGTLATAADIASNPEIARAHLIPTDDPIISDFRNTRTMNWEKIPVLMPLAYEVLHRFMGNRVDRISRPAFAERPKLMAAVMFFALGALLLLPPAYLTTRRFRHARLRERLAGLPAWLRARQRRADERV